MADDKDDDSNKNRPTLVVVPPATIVAESVPVATQVEFQPKPITIQEAGIMSVRHYNTITVLSGGASGGFAVLVAVTFIGAATGLIPLWAIEWIARIWGILCLGYVLLETVPLAVAVNMSNAEFKIDRYTSIAPLAITVIAVIAFWVRAPLVSDLWIIAIESLLASLIDIALVYALVHVRHQVAVLIVESRRKDGPKDQKAA
ncbi:MAG TPA: hypothetical protein VMU25_04815 [Candidatus Paceibacterota bacterium]|nr:hypothetical protein [Candidatus Paceibacterota bacterium]